MAYDNPLPYRSDVRQENALDMNLREGESYFDSFKQCTGTLCGSFVSLDAPRVTDPGCPGVILQAQITRRAALFSFHFRSQPV